MAETGGPESEIAQRLRLLRTTLGYDTQRAFAAFLEIEYKRYSNLENGFPISSQVVVLLCKKISGLSSDWIYFGREDALSVSLATRLRSADVNTRTG